MKLRLFGVNNTAPSQNQESEPTQRPAKTENAAQQVLIKKEPQPSKKLSLNVTQLQENPLKKKAVVTRQASAMAPEAFAISIVNSAPKLPNSGKRIKISISHDVDYAVKLSKALSRLGILADIISSKTSVSTENGKTTLKDI